MLRKSLAAALLFSAQAFAAAVTPPTLVWQADLDDIAGTYRFAQVSSPGGLWNVRNNSAESRQVSINEVPQALRDKLLNAEIKISELGDRTIYEANEGPSPAGNVLRDFMEARKARVTVKNLPGIDGGRTNDGPDFEGEVELEIFHSSVVRNVPARNSIIRGREEPTWGAAAVDYADLRAVAHAHSEEPAEAAPVEGESAAEAPHAEDLPIIDNARVLRSGNEIIVSIYWIYMEGTESEALYRGSVRLVKVPPGS